MWGIRYTSLTALALALGCSVKDVPEDYVGSKPTAASTAPESIDETIPSAGIPEPQTAESPKSVDDTVEDPPDEPIEPKPYLLPKMSLFWLEEALGSANVGLTKRAVEGAIGQAEAHAEKAGMPIPKARIDEIWAAYRIGIRLHGPRHMERMLTYATEWARKGSAYDIVQIPLNLARQYAIEAGIPNPEKRMANIISKVR